jgi:hypothetical protein
MHDDFRFLALKGRKDHEKGDKETMRWHCWFLGEDVHSLGDLPRDSHHSSELQSISPPSLEAASCSTGTTVITVLQEQQL